MVEGEAARAARRAALAARDPRPPPARAGRAHRPGERARRAAHRLAGQPVPRSRQGRARARARPSGLLGVRTETAVSALVARDVNTARTSVVVSVAGLAGNVFGGLLAILM